MAKITIGKKRYIDQQDLKTKAFIQDNFPQYLGEDIHTRTPEGMFIRNEFGAYSQLTVADKGKHDIILPLVGGCHVIGGHSKFGLSLHTDSLSSSLITQHKHTHDRSPPPVHIPLIFLSNDSVVDDSIIKQAKNHAEPILFLKGISDEDYHEGPNFNLSYQNSKASEEQEFVEKIWDQSGGKNSPRPKPELFNTYKEIAKKAIGAPCP